MRIRVEEAVDQHHLQHGVGAAGGEQLAVEARGVHRLEIRRRDAVDPIHHEERRSRELRMHARHHDRLAAAEAFREALLGASLGAEIDFARERLAQLANDLHGLVAPRLGLLFLPPGGERFEQQHIGFDRGLDSRAPDLHRDLRPAGKRRAMHLRDRARRARRDVESGESARDRRAEVSEQLRLERVEGDRARVVVEAVEARDPFGAEQVHA